MEWMLLPYKKYADFNGRSRRKEYWMFALSVLIVYAICGLLMVAADFLATPALIIIGLFALATMVPAIAVQVRRFHDQDKSGWFVLLNLIPYLGGLVVLVFMCLDGTNGPNRFGDDPKGRAAGVFE